MIRKINLVFVLLCVALFSYAQPVNRLNYQSVARNSSGAILGNQALGILISIENGSSGPVLYSERHVVLTNQFGLFTLQIGAGTPITGTYNSINWSAGNQWLKVDMDPTGGNSYTPMGESQLLAVPYANYAASGGTTYAPGTGINISSNVISNTITALSNLTDVNTTGATSGKLLGYNGTTWVPVNDSLGSGTVTSVTAGTGLSGGTITTTGTISMPNVGTAGTYGSASLIPVITTDAQGRVTNVTTASLSGGGYTGGTGISIVGNVINSVWTQSGNNIYNNNTANVGIETTTPGYLLHVVGSAGAATAIGVVSNSNGAGIGFGGQNTAAVGAGAGDGIFGATQQSAGFGVYAANLNSAGTGLIAIGNNVASYILPGTGAGGAFYGNLIGGYGFSASNTGYGLYGKATDATSAYGVVGTANNVAGAAPSTGVGGGFSGYNYGVSGYQTNQTVGVQTASGYFAEPASTTLVEAFSVGGTHYKIWGSPAGTVSTTVPDLNGNQVTLHAPETPEFYFQDYGQSRLTNGRAHIDIDPVLAKNVTINERHPLRVFVQMEGDCNGVYITNKTASGFDVVELNGGTSNVNFQWSVTCNVADAQIGNRLSKFADLRFEPGPIDELRKLSNEEKLVQPAKSFQK